MKKLYGLFAAIVLILLDQITKIAAYNNLSDNGTAIKSVPLIKDVLEFSFVKNTGAAWGMMSDNTIILGIISLIISIGIVFIYIKIPMQKKYIILHVLSIVIFAGAFGNLIDRFFRGYVIDFIYFKLIDFPVFNVADIYVCVAAIAFIILSFTYYEDSDFDFLKKK